MLKDPFTPKLPQRLFIMLCGVSNNVSVLLRNF